MKTAMLRAGPVALSFGAALCSTGGYAQERAGQECAGISEPAAEIACLREALEASRRALAETSGEHGAASLPPARPSRPPEAAPAAETAVLGREQLSTHRETRDAAPAPALGMQAVVLSATEDRQGLFRITLDNGQVWKQSDRPGLQIPIRSEHRYSVEIKRSAFGGYRMHFPELDRTIVVKRVL